MSVKVGGDTVVASSYIRQYNRQNMKKSAYVCVPNNILLINKTAVEDQTG
jgi:hypothetical protein